jgi:hypothetical protein
MTPITDAARAKLPTMPNAEHAISFLLSEMAKLESKSIVAELLNQFTPIERWGYEQAMTSEAIVRLPREDGASPIEHEWSKLFGESADNKVTYKAVQTSEICSPFFITFHDSKIHIGSSIRAYRGGNELVKSKNRI